MIYIHKLQIWTSIDRKHYEEMQKVISHPMAKNNIHYERLGQQRGIQNVKYILHGNGTIMIYISCSKNPFRLFREEDVSKIMTFLGRLEDRLRRILSDTRDLIV